MQEQAIDAPASTPPDTVTIVSDIWSRSLGPKGRARNVDLLHVGVGTKRILRLLDEIEQAFGVKLPIGTALKLGTIERLAEAIDTGRRPAPSPLVLLKDGGAQPPVYLIAGAWGIILEMCKLAAVLDYPGKVWGLQPTGFEGDEVTLHTVEDTAAYYADHLCGAVDQPVNILGFSYGGLVALEMGRILQRRNRKIGLIGLIDTGLAERRWPIAVRARYLWKRTMVRLRGVFSVQRERRADAIRNFVQPLRKRLLGLFFIDASYTSPYQPELDPRLKAALDNILVANERYVPSRVDFPVALFKGEQTAEDLGATWGRHIRSLEVVEVAGLHTHMLLPPLVSDLAATIATRLKRSERSVQAG